MKSKFLSLNERDFIKGFILACITASLTSIYNFLQSGDFLSNGQWKVVVIAGITSGIGYIIKNTLENSDGQFAKEPLV